MPSDDDESTQENPRLSVVQHIPEKRLRICWSSTLTTLVTRRLRSAFDSVANVALDITPTAKTAIRLLSAEPYDLVAVDPAISPGGFALLKYIKDNYRWTATLIATHNQEPQFLREAISCRIDGLLFRPATSAGIRRAGAAPGQGGQRAPPRQQKRVLAIGAHPDDVEIGCGGALAKHHDDYDVLHILTLSRGAAGGDINVRVAEAHDAAAMVGARARDGEPARHRHHRRAPRRSRSSRPRSASCTPRMSTRIRNEDTHQDHRAVHAATLVAARGVPNVYCYQTPSSTVDFKPHRFVDITHFIDQKIDLIGAYKSQVDRMESLQPDVILSTARYWGRFAGYVLAEPLQIIRQRDSESGARRRPRQAAACQSMTRGRQLKGAKHADPDHRRGRRRGRSASGRACRPSTSCTWPTSTRWPPASISCRRTAA